MSAATMEIRLKFQKQNKQNKTKQNKTQDKKKP